MDSFCPDGYVFVQEALVRAATCWFQEELGAIEAEGELRREELNDKLSSLSDTERLARAFAISAIPQDLQRRIQHLLVQAERRLRNYLHQGNLTAYYFGGLIDHERRDVPREFWATAEADGILRSGVYWPYGKPHQRHKQRPNRSLYFLASELETLLSSQPTLSNPEETTEFRGREREAVDCEIATADRVKAGPGAKEWGIMEVITETLA